MIPRNGSAVHARSTAGDAEATLVAQLQALAPQLDGEPDTAFRAATRARLVAMAAVRSPEPEPSSPLRRLLTLRTADAVPAPWRTRLTAGLAGAALTVTALSTMAALSTDARPGDVLYGLKRGTEQTQVALAGDSRGQTLLELAGTRLDEVEYLVSDGAIALPAVPPQDAIVVQGAGTDTDLVIDTLATMDAQTTEGAAWLAERAVTTEDAAPLDDLAGWAAGQSADLAALEPEVPAAARPAFDESQQLVAEIATRTAGLRTALDCPAGPATGGADELGPVPEACQAAPPVAGEDPTTSPDADGSAPLPAPTGEVPGQSGGDPADPRSGTPGSDLPRGVPGSDSPVSVPPTEVPVGGPTTPPLPLPSVEVPPPGLPSVPLPGTTPTPSVDAELDVCLGPISIGDC